MVTLTCGWWSDHRPAVWCCATAHAVFCMLTAVSNVILMRDFRHTHAYVVVMKVQISR